MGLARGRGPKLGLDPAQLWALPQRRPPRGGHEGEAVGGGEPGQRGVDEQAAAVLVPRQQIVRAGRRAGLPGRGGAHQRAQPPAQLPAPGALDPHALVAHRAQRLARGAGCCDGGGHSEEDEEAHRLPGPLRVNI